MFDSYQICLDVAEQGEGIALGWGRSVKSRLESGRLVRIAGMTMPLPDIVNVYRPKSAKSNQVAEQFIDLLRTRMEPVE